MSSDNSGNSGFSRVANVAAPIDTLNVDTLVAGSISIAGVGQVVGYLPTDGTGVASYWLNNVSGVVSQGAATSAAATTLVLPTGAVISRVVVRNNGVVVVGGTSFGCGTALVTAAAPNSGTGNIATAMTTATVNSTSGGIVGAVAAFASAGASTLAAVAANTGVFITNTAAITSGSIVVTSYFTL